MAEGRLTAGAARRRVCARIPLALAALAWLALLGAPGSAPAQPVAVPETWGRDVWSRPRLTGSWGGLRDEIGKKGVVLDVDLIMTPQGVLTGGRDTGAVFWGNAEYTLNVDTGKLGLWPGGFLKVYAGSSFGDSISSDSGALLPVNTLTFYRDSNQSSTGLMQATVSGDFLPFELYYSAAITAWLSATADLQIVEPGLARTLGSSGRLEDAKTAVVAGRRVVARF